MKLKRKTLFMMFSAGKQAIELANHVKCNADLKLKVHVLLVLLFKSRVFNIYILII